ncbi:hypothetical protein PDL71_15420 [Lacibacter sp. MH-610]|uniref:hypothetical protein n=1 Tax=Lacibacter sp. MH-610 TaxID=3020883 RepID=UPI003891BDE5
MKQVITILTLVCSMAVQGQSVIDGQYYQNMRRNDKIDRVLHDSIMGLPQILASKGKRPGSLFYNISDSSVYVWTGVQALKIGSGGSFSGIDSGAFRNIVALGDSGLIFERANGIKDTVIFANGSGGGGGGGSTDTTSLSNRINQKLNISDTASMLNPYMRKVIDTGTIANRPVSPFIGQRYYQTDELVGFYKYTPRGWQWEYPEMIYDIKFHSMTGSTNPRLTTFTANGGFVGAFNAYPLGMNESAIFVTGTNSNGVSGFRLNTSQSVPSFSMSTRYMVMQHRVVFSHTSNSTDRFVFYAGSRDVEQTDGTSNSIFWRYTDTLNSGNWQLVIVDGGGTTTINTSTAVDDSTIYNLVVQKEPTFIRAFINGTKVGEAVLTEPATVFPVLMNAAIVKRSGTAERRFLIDKIRLYEY